METLPMTTGFGQDQAETPGLDNGDNDDDENSCDDDNDNDKKDNDDKNKNKNDNVCFSAALTKSTFLQTAAKLDHARSLLDLKKKGTC